MPLKSFPYSAGRWHRSHQLHSTAGEGSIERSPGRAGNPSGEVACGCFREYFLEFIEAVSQRWRRGQLDKNVGGYFRRGSHPQRHETARTGNDSCLAQVSWEGQRVIWSSAPQTLRCTRITCGILLTCRLQFSGSGEDSEMLHFIWVPRGCQCCWSAEAQSLRILKFLRLLPVPYRNWTCPGESQVPKQEACREEGPCPRWHSLRWHLLIS